MKTTSRQHYNPKDVHVLVRGTWDYVTMHRKEDLEDVIKVDEPQRWSCRHKGPFKKKRQRVRCRERHTRMEAETRRNKRYYTAGFEDGRVGHKLRNAGDL